MMGTVATASTWQAVVLDPPAARAIAQLGMHLLFVLQISSGPEGANNNLDLAFACSSSAWMASARSSA